MRLFVSPFAQHDGPVPSPLEGEGWGGGWLCMQSTLSFSPPPLTPPHKGEGNTPVVRPNPCVNN
jgi:hypothetical protein